MTAVVRRRHAIVIGAAIFVTTAVAVLRVPLLPVMGEDLGADPAALGLLVAAFGAGRLVANVPAGRTADRIPANRMVAIAAAIVAVGSVVLAVAPSLGVAAAGTAALGTGSAWTNTTGLTFFSSRAPHERRGRSLSIFAVTFLGGQALGPSLGGLLSVWAGWRVALAIGGGVALVLAVFLLGRAEPGRHGTPASDAQRSDTAARRDSRAGRLVVYALPLVQFTIGGALLQTVIPLAASGELSLGPAAIGTVLGIGGLARIVGALVGGWVADRRSRRAAILPGLALQSVGVATLYVSGVPALILAIVLLSLGSVSVSVGAAVLADHSPPTQVGARLGIFRQVGDVGMLLGPPLAGWLYATGGRSRALGPVLLLTVAVLGAAAVMLPHTHLSVVDPKGILT